MKESMQEKINILLVGVVFSILGSFLAYSAHLFANSFVGKKEYHEHLIGHQEVRTYTKRTTEDIVEIKEDIRWIRRQMHRDGKPVVPR